jgi:hypothetical protein
MAQLRVLFDVPKWIEVGVKTGQLSIFGGIVRNNAGRIVYMLKEGTRLARFARGPWALPALAVAAAAGVGYGIYKLLSDRPKALEELEAVDRAILTYGSAAHAQRLNVEEIRSLAAELQNLIAAMESPELKDAAFDLDAEAADKLREFYASLRSFNMRLKEEVKRTREVPQLVDTGRVLELV